MYTLEGMIKEMDDESPEIMRYVGEAKNMRESARNALDEAKQALDSSRYKEAHSLMGEGRIYFLYKYEPKICGLVTTVGIAAGADLANYLLTGNAEVKSTRFTLEFFLSPILTGTGLLIGLPSWNFRRTAKKKWESAFGKDALTEENVEKLAREVEKYKELYNIDIS